MSFSHQSGLQFIAASFRSGIPSILGMLTVRDWPCFFHLNLIIASLDSLHFIAYNNIAESFYLSGLNSLFTILARS